MDFEGNQIIEHKASQKEVEGTEQLQHHINTESSEPDDIDDQVF